MTYLELKYLYSIYNYKFREEEMALNLFGARSLESQSNKFDDVIGCAWIQDGEANVIQFPATTDPGKYYLQNPMKKEGTIIVVPGQYLDVYCKGLHAGKYDAFKQYKPMAYVRDNDRNIELDFSLYRDENKRKKYLFWAIQGTNLHRASEWQIVQWVEKYSAGCQVVQDPKNFAKLIDLRNKSIKFGYNSWDYTLFDEGMQIT
jgi:hypothetical protein